MGEIDRQSVPQFISHPSSAFSRVISSSAYLETNALPTALSTDFLNLIKDLNRREQQLQTIKLLISKGLTNKEIGGYFGLNEKNVSVLGSKWKKAGLIAFQQITEGEKHELLSELSAQGLLNYEKKDRPSSPTFNARYIRQGTSGFRLTPKQILELKMELIKGKRFKEVADNFGLNAATVRGYANRFLKELGDQYVIKEGRLCFNSVVPVVKQLHAPSLRPLARQDVINMLEEGVPPEIVAERFTLNRGTVLYHAKKKIILSTESGIPMKKRSCFAEKEAAITKLLQEGKSKKYIQNACRTGYLKILNCAKRLEKEEQERQKSLASKLEQDAEIKVD